MILGIGDVLPGYLVRVCAAKCLHRTIRQCWLDRDHWRFCQQIKCASRLSPHAVIILKIAAHTHYKEWVQFSQLKTVNMVFSIYPWMLKCFHFPKKIITWSIMTIKQRGRVAVDQNQASGRIKQKLFCFTFISAADNNTAQLQQQQQQHKMLASCTLIST